MQPFAAPFNRPDHWIEEAIACPLTAPPLPSTIETARAARRVVLHAGAHRHLYEDPCSNGEAFGLLRRLGTAQALNEAEIPETDLMDEALREAQEWAAMGESELSSSAARDALLAVNAFTSAASLEILDLAQRLFEALCARVLEHRAAEALFSSNRDLSARAASILDVVSAGVSLKLVRPQALVSHLLAARFFRARYAASNGFLRPYASLTRALASAASSRAESLTGAECVDAVATELTTALLSEALTILAQVYLSETLPQAMAVAESATDD